MFIDPRTVAANDVDKYMLAVQHRDFKLPRGPLLTALLLDHSIEAQCYVAGFIFCKLLIARFEQDGEASVYKTNTYLRQELECVLAHRLLAARKNKKLSRRKLAELTGVSASSIDNIEHERQTPSVACLVKLADALEVSTDYLLGRIADDS